MTAQKTVSLAERTIMSTSRLTVNTRYDATSEESPTTLLCRHQLRLQSATVKTAPQKLRRYVINSDTVKQR